MKIIKKYEHISIIAFIFIILIITRLFIINNSYCVIDFDESILALMAKKLINGVLTPPCFYGQKYGLAFFEILFVGLFFLIFGISPVSLKLGIFSFWIIGVYFFYLSILKIFNRKVAILSTILIGISPAWFLWSIKARGGYVTGFVFFNILLWLTTRNDNKYLPFYMGSILGIIGFSHPIWFVISLPFILMYLKNNKIKYVKSILCAIVMYLFFYLLNLKLNQFNTYWFPPIFSNIDLLKNIYKLPEKLIINLSGSYDYYQILHGKLFCIINGCIWFVILVINNLYIFYNYIRKKKYTIHYCCILGGINLTVFNLLINDNWFCYRYFLPITILIVIPLSDFIIKLDNLIFKKYFITILIGISLLGCYELIPAKKLIVFNTSKQKPIIETLVDVLLLNQFYNVYCLEKTSSLQYQIMFYSNEKIFARNKFLRDRFIQTSMIINDLYENNTALIVDAYNLKKLIKYYERMNKKLSKIYNVGNVYYIIPNPNNNLLKNFKFEFDKQ